MTFKRSFRLIAPGLLLVLNLASTRPALAQLRTKTTASATSAQSAHVFLTHVSDTLDPNRPSWHSVLSDAMTAIANKRSQLPWLGEPTSQVEPGADMKHGEGYGYFRHFQAGTIFWTASYGAHEVHGAIRDKYASMGWENSYLGYPQTDELSQTYLGLETRYNNFEDGRIEWTANRGAFIDAFVSADYRSNQLGYDLTVNGAGFQPGETVHMCIADLEGFQGCKSIGAASAEWDGRFSYFNYTSYWRDGSGMATLQAVGGASGIVASTPVAAMY